MAPNSDKGLRDRLAAHLRRVTHERGWSPARLGREIGVSQPLAYRLLTGKRTIGLDVFAKLHQRLGLDANALLDQDPAPAYFEPRVPRRSTLTEAADELANVADAPGTSPDRAKRLRILADTLRRTGAK